MKKLTASDAQAGDQFGLSAGISGDTGIVGAFFEDAGAPDAGAAYVFQVPPVGGLAVDLDGDAPSTPLDTAQSSGGNTGLLAGVTAAVAAAAVALGGAA